MSPKDLELFKFRGKTRLQIMLDESHYGQQHYPRVLSQLLRRNLDGVKFNASRT
jgi:hypothetical protein